MCCTMSCLELRRVSATRDPARTASPTQLWPRPYACSPGKRLSCRAPQLTDPCVGSTTDHFISFSGVDRVELRARVDAYGARPTVGSPAIAVPDLDALGVCSARACCPPRLRRPSGRRPYEHAAHRGTGQPALGRPGASGRRVATFVHLSPPGNPPCLSSPPSDHEKRFQACTGCSGPPRNWLTAATILNSVTMFAGMRRSARSAAVRADGTCPSRVRSSEVGRAATAVIRSGRSLTSSRRIELDRVSARAGPRDLRF